MDTKKQRKYLKELIESVERDVVNNQVQLFIYEKEVANPTYIGKEQAQQGVDIHKKRIEYLNANLTAYTLYISQLK